MLRSNRVQALSDLWHSYDISPGIPRSQLDRVLASEEVRGFYSATGINEISNFHLRYFLFLFINVIFIFLLASTYWQLVRDLANSPAKIPEKLAEALQRGSARLVHFHR